MIHMHTVPLWDIWFPYILLQSSSWNWLRYWLDFPYVAGQKKSLSWLPVTKILKSNSCQNGCTVIWSYPSFLQPEEHLLTCPKTHDSISQRIIIWQAINRAWWAKPHMCNSETYTSLNLMVWRCDCEQQSFYTVPTTLPFTEQHNLMKQIVSMNTNAC